MHIAGRKKKGHITRRNVAPVEDDSNYDEWNAEDALVQSWLINSMTDQLMSHFMQCGTAKEVWDAVKRSYLDVFDSSQVYEILSITLRKHAAKDQVYIFHAGLDHSLDQVSGCILATSALPSLKEAYSLVRHEAQRQVTMRTEYHSEASAMAIHKNSTRPTSFTPTDSSSRFCTHCNSTKHIADVC
ncbi:hypothetical protein CK203_079835 [Vitis vinifera]|uniref:Retrotransposon Copia-like N-terminal domain-containing protein n=1 Tax=Vitis vinifera TaxID=29760 RepID=A0A438DHV8_VITVI|nr:hypothetical protein CK203_079835 [Vitis vinifera]